MDLKLAGKTVLITGGSKGIGFACAMAFAAEGCAVHIASRSKDTLEAARDKIRARHNVPVEIHSADFSKGECANDECRGLGDGGAALDERNVMLRCASCHSRKTASQRAKRR